MRKWNPKTRNIRYNPAMVCERLLYYAKQYRDRGHKSLALDFEFTADEIERNTRVIAHGVELIITAAEDLILNDDSFLDMEKSESP